jgi:Tfp pilus assembly protein PilZ
MIGSGGNAMKQRPWEIILISIIYILAPIGNILQAMFINHSTFIDLIHQFKVIDWLILISYPVIGVMVFTVKKWGWYLFIGFSFILIVLNVIGYLRNINYSFMMLVVFNVLIIGITALFFRRHVMSPYFNPRVRWWEVPARFKLNLTATLHSDQNIIESQILDISKSGCFVQTETPLAINDKIWLEIKFSDKEVDCFGKVVRTAGSKEEKNGYGIMFLSIGKESRNLLNGLVQTLQKMGVSDRSFDEELNKNIAQLVK